MKNPHHPFFLLCVQQAAKHASYMRARKEFGPWLLK